MSSKIALITGGTSGIGRACAELYLENNFKVIITGRRLDRLAEFKSRYEEGRVHVLCFDIRNEEQVIESINSLPNEWKYIDVLVNNAGLALGLSRFFDGNSQHWDSMLDTNVKGLLYVSKVVANGMKQSKKGHVVNIGSIAGKEVYMNGNVYCASKHAVDALTQAMRIELAEFNVRVSAVHPGAVDTEFSEVRFEGNKEKADQVYVGFENLIAEDIADAVYYITSRKSHVNINDLVIMPTAQPKASIIHRKG